MGYREDKCKVKGPRNHKISNCYNANDYYDYYKTHNENTISQTVFSAVFKACIMDLVQSYLLDYLVVDLPEKLGSLKCYTVQHKLYRDVNGKLVKKAPIDWNATLKFWEDDPGAEKLKVKIYSKHKDVVKIGYDKFNQSYKNHIYYKLYVSRPLKKFIYRKLVLNDNFNLNG